jgi:hypothetical protein
MIESLVGTLDARTDDIEQRLKRFSTLLDESLEGATGRAREIARIVAESSAEGTRALEEERRRGNEIASIVAEASAEGTRVLEEERRRAREATQSMYTEHSGEVHELFTSTMQRFAETLQGMRQMAAEMQRELETTRGELRKGILELPQETAESASQMRRVIVEQIEALAELNRIVARHGRGLDAAETPRQPQRQPEPAFAGGRPQQPRMERPPRMEPPRNLPPQPRPDIAAPVPPRAEAPSLSPGQGGGRNGWLSELLHRASKPEGGADERSAVPGERPAHHSLESLDSLSVDIARMIDHDAAAELWERYKRGERNVFTRRLYTLQGQQTFEEIRKRYRGDREFKQTVDRYIGEFERLLEEVSRGDRGQVVARTYLTSETGKVYTMLAHAAGRFGE